MKILSNKNWEFATKWFLVKGIFKSILKEKENKWKRRSEMQEEMVSKENDKCGDI